MERAPLLVQVSNRAIQLPEFVPGIATHGYMALNADRASTLDDYGSMRVYGRGVKENTIFEGTLSFSDEVPQLYTPSIVLSNRFHPRTLSGIPISGYEDPTFLTPESNPVDPNHRGLLATGTVYKNGRDDSAGVFAHLVYRNLDQLNLPPETIATHEMIDEQLGFYVDMIKEAETFTHREQPHVYAEYGDGKHSNIAIARIVDRRLADTRTFYSAPDDESEHVSTAGQPIVLEDGRQLLVFNRRRNNEWSVSCMLQTDPLTPDPYAWERSAILTAGATKERGPGNQLIAFGSCVLPFDGPNGIRLLYHINDKSLGEAIFEINRRAL